MMQQSALRPRPHEQEEEDYVRRVLRRDDARYVEVFLTEKAARCFTLSISGAPPPTAPAKRFSPQELTAAFAMIGA